MASSALAPVTSLKSYLFLDSGIITFANQEREQAQMILSYSGKMVQQQIQSLLTSLSHETPTRENTGTSLTFQLIWIWCAVMA